MSGQGIAQILVYVVALIALGYPLGLYMARVYNDDDFGTRGRLRWLGAMERGFFRVVHVDGAREQGWKGYAKVTLIFSAIFSLFLYGMLRLQGHLFLNPDHLPAVPSHIALNTTASFITNTNWQYYGGEYTMSYLTQMAGLAVQNFVSAAVGMAVLAAVVRGIARRSRERDRQLLARPLPLARLHPAAARDRPRRDPHVAGRRADVPRPRHRDDAPGRAPDDRARPRRVADRDQAARHERRRLLQLELGRPFENPNGLSNFLELLAILLIPAGQVFMFGKMVGARRHAWMVFAAMFAVFAIGVGVNLPAEQHGSQVLRNSGVNITAGARPERRQHGRQGGSLRARPRRPLWTVATSDASNGSVNGGFDAQTPAGGAVPLVNLFLGEVIFGGVGSGLYGMFFYIIIAVFIAGLMVGRTPEWLGKKIEAREIKIAALGALFVPTMVLTMTAVAIVTKSGLASIYNHGVHGFTETLYAYDSQSNNNGSAFAGYGATSFSASLGTVAMYLGRFVPLLAALALGGSLAQKKIVPASAGTFRTDGATFVVLLVGVIALTAGLMILPALTLGPIVEGLMH